MGWGEGPWGNLAAERPLDKNKNCCFLNRGQVGKKSVTEREDERTREVKMNERLREKVNDGDKA